MFKWFMVTMFAALIGLAYADIWYTVLVLAVFLVGVILDANE